MQTLKAETPEFLTPNEVAAKLGQSRATVYRKIATGLLPAVRLGPSSRSPLRIVADELDEWLFTPERERPA
jgi:excisionase family DNA binding protein